MNLQNYVGGAWVVGRNEGRPLLDPVLGTELARATTDGIDLAAALDYARRQGSLALQALTYVERAALLTKIADVLTTNRNDYLRISLENSGSTEADAAVDIEGSIYTLKYFARSGASLGDGRYLREGAAQSLSKDGLFQAQHFLLPVKGAAILINAFNFPAWGLWEKAAPALLSGVPVFAKPATATALLTQRMVHDVIAAGVLPTGALSIICGDARDLLDHVTHEDVVSFTGSADTAQRIRSHAAVVQHATRINIEADSVNCALLGADVQPGSAEFELFVREVVREMTVKSGQKCTAIRRALVPAALHSDVAEAIAGKLAKVVVGNPRNATVRMGPLVSRAQQVSALSGLQRLKAETTVVFGGGEFLPVDSDTRIAAFIPPTLLSCADPLTATNVHDVEVFGPVATLIPYTTEHQAFTLAQRGLGSLVASIFSADDAFNTRAVLALGSSHGRILSVNEAVGQTQTGHGNVMPMCLHGGPGRAGGGEELGGLRGLGFYHRRVALQGHSARLAEFATNAAEWLV